MVSGTGMDIYCELKVSKPYGTRLETFHVMIPLYSIQNMISYMSRNILALFNIKIYFFLEQDL